MKLGVAITVVLATGCLNAEAVVCEDGVVCAPGQVCAPEGGGCGLPEQIDDCVGKDDGDPCTFLGATGRCSDGVCIGILCGNGEVDAGEACDDGNTLDGDGCSGTCVKRELCGDGVIDATEGCDNGLDNADTVESTCRTDCSLPHCGDGVVVTSAGEACEPGVDFVDVDCTDYGFYDAAGLGCGSLCQPDISGCARECGDDVIDDEEICDGAPPPGACLDYGFDAGPLGCVACAPGFGDCHFVGWKQFFGEPGGVTAIYGWPDDVFAISTGVIRRFDGHAWTTHATLPTSVYPGNTAKLWGSSPDDLYAAGPDFVVHVTPAGVETLFTGGTFSVSGTAADDVWVVGHDDKTVRHFDGVSWSTLGPLETPGVDVWAAAPDDVFVAVSSGVFHWDGADWTLAELRGYAPRRIWGSGPDDIYVGGLAGSLLHFDGTSWRPVPLGIDVDVLAIAGTGPDDVYVTGAFGTILHHDGVGWEMWRDTSDYGMASVWPVSTTDVIASDDLGIYEYRGAAWTPMSLRAAGATLNSVAAAGPTEMFAVGKNGTILSHDGRAWTLDDPITGFTLNEAWASGPDDRFAVGNSGTILHDDGTGWTVMTSGTYADLFDVWGSGPTDVYASGASPAGLLHYDGTSWSPVADISPDPIQDVWGLDEDNVYAVGGGNVYHYDGTTWTVTMISAGNLYAVVGRHEGDVYVSGNNGVYQWNGSIWQAHSSGTQEVVNMSVADTLIWGVGANGAVYFEGGGGWVPQPDAKIIGRGVLATTERVVFVGDDMTVLHFSNSIGYEREVPYVAAVDPLFGQALFDLWSGDGYVYATQMYSPSQALARHDGRIWSSVRTPEFGSGFAADRIWGASADDLFVLGHAAPWIQRFDGTAFTPQTITGVTNLTDLWGAAADDVFAVGDSVIVHFDGTTWTTTVATDVLRGVWGSGGDDVFAVGDAGTILHFDGTSWTPHTSGTTSPLVDVWGTGPTDVFAAGGDVVLHYDGTAWSPLDPGTSAQFHRITGTGPGDVLFTYDLGVLRYDGARFSPVRLPSTDGYRAAFADGDSIYFAGVNRGVDRLLRTEAW